MSEDFYREFEERYRGSREDIKSRLRVYRPWLEQLRALKIGQSALDLGCGRGEWLEVLRDSDFHAIGVDAKTSMTAGLRDAGFAIHNGDALSYLRGAADQSFSLVSAFHLVEHLGFETLQALVTEALRVLKPGGLLILETPNPENLTVGATTFYQDPTHSRPLPPALLGFVPEHVGFARTRVMRLREPEGLAGYSMPTLSHVLMGISPDYAVIAQRGGSANAVAAFDSLFERPYGVNLKDVVDAYDARAHKLETDLWKSIEVTQFELNKLAERVSLAERGMREAQERMSQLANSWSWRLTAPLRAVAGIFKGAGGR